jgi:hypothetical protein
MTHVFEQIPRSDRVERTSSRAGLLPLWTITFSRRTRLRRLPGIESSELAVSHTINSMPVSFRIFREHRMSYNLYKVLGIATIG